MAKIYTGKGKKGEHEAEFGYRGPEPPIPETDPHPDQEPSIPEPKVPPKKGKK